MIHVVSEMMAMSLMLMIISISSLICGIDLRTLLNEHRWVNKQEKRFVDSTRRFSLLYRHFLSPLCYPRPPFLREAFGNRSGCVPCPSPMRHAYSPAPRFSPSRPRSPLFQLQFTYILSAFIQNRACSQKKFPESFAVKPKVRTFALAFRKGSPSDKRMDL